MREDMRRAHRGLICLGLDPGAVDGLWGQKTKGAYSALLARSDASPKGAVASPAPSAGSMLYQGTGQAFRARDRGALLGHPARLVSGLSAQAKRGENRRWHTDPTPKGNSWKDIGYHWLINRDGTLLMGRFETEIGAGVVGHNQGVIHICLIGGRGGNGRNVFSKHFTPAQDRTLRDLVDAIGMWMQVAHLWPQRTRGARVPLFLCPCLAQGGLTYERPSICALRVTSYPPFSA